jgi:hypothetical protein
MPHSILHMDITRPIDNVTVELWQEPSQVELSLHDKEHQPPSMCKAWSPLTWQPRSRMLLIVNRASAQHSKLPFQIVQTFLQSEPNSPVVRGQMQYTGIAPLWLNPRQDSVDPMRHSQISFTNRLSLTVTQPTALNPASLQKTTS